MNTDFFSGIKQWEMEWEGEQALLPVFYYDTTSITAIYTADTNKIRALLPPGGMYPVELYPGRALIAFSAFEYHKTDIDPYNEFAVAVIVSYGKPRIAGITPVLQMARRHFSAYIWQLPVTTEIARKGGVQMYGFPKFIAGIAFEKSGSAITCHLSEGDEKILSLRGRVLPTRREKVTRFTTYSMIGDIPIKANVFINPIRFAQTMTRSAATLELGSSHFISRTLAGLGLSPYPITYQYSPVNQGILFAGRNIMDD